MDMDTNMGVDLDMYMLMSKDMDMTLHMDICRRTNMEFYMLMYIDTFINI